MAGESKASVLAALAGNTAVAVTKYVAAWFSGSSSMFSEAVHSTADTCNQLLMLFGMHQAAKPPSKRHPLGHGLELYFWTFVVAVLLFGLGAGVSIWEGVSKIRAPHPIEDAWINYLVLGLCFLFEGGSWLFALHNFRKSSRDESIVEAVMRSKDPTVFTVLFEDSAALVGILIAALMTFLSERLQMPVLDGVGSLLIGLLLGVTASWLAYECRGLLIGESVHPAIRDGIVRIAGETSGVDGVNAALTMHFGPHDVLVLLSLDFADAQSAAEVENSVSAIERRVRKAYPEVKRVFVEAQTHDAHLASAHFPVSN